MSLQSSEQIEADVLELCSEDDYGSWELWWNTSAEIPSGEISVVRSRFLKVITNLVAAEKLIAKRRSEDGKIVAAPYDQEELAVEVSSADDPDPNSYFWFGTG